MFYWSSEGAPPHRLAVDGSCKKNVAIDRNPDVFGSTDRLVLLNDTCRENVFWRQADPVLNPSKTGRHSEFTVLVRGRRPHTHYSENSDMSDLFCIQMIGVDD